MKSFTVRCRKSVFGSSLILGDQRIWRNSQQVLNSFPLSSGIGRGQVSGSVKSLGADFKYLKCCCTPVLGLLWVAGVPGREALLYFGELLIIAGASWRQFGTTIPGWGTDTPRPSVWTHRLLIYEFLEVL